MHWVECESDEEVAMSLPFFLVTIESGYPVPNFVSYASRIRRFSLVPETIIASSFASRGIAGVVVTTIGKDSLVLAFIAATISSLAIKGQISVVLSLMI
jgi:hypothetical protein